MHLSVPPSWSITSNSDRQEAEAKGTLYLIGFHSAFLINNRQSLTQGDIAADGAAGLQVWDWGSQDLRRHSDLQANGVGGLLAKGFVKDPHKRTSPRVLSLG